MLIFGLVVSIIICFLVPIGGFLLLKGRKIGLGRAFFVGILTFTVSQILLRIPILTAVLPNFMWFQVMQVDIWAYGIFLGSTAALFEEGARWITMKLFLKDRWDMQNGIAFGLGHSGIEAMLFVGVNMVVNLVMTLAGNGFLLPTDGGNVLLGGVERLSAMAFHVGASLIVMYGLSVGKSGRFLLVAFLLHTLLDAASVILTKQYGMGTIAFEIICAVFGALVLGYGLYLFRKNISGKEKENLG